MDIQPIGHIENVYTGKFGIPRQSGLAGGVVSRLVFEKDYAREEAFRGLEGFSHLWLIWEFSENVGRGWSPTVRPPKLGGNTRVGVFATRSPMRPNPLGLSCVHLERVEIQESQVSLLVTGADLMDGTPIYDVKPYIPYTDAHPEALSSYVPEPASIRLSVRFDCEVPVDMDGDLRQNLTDILAQDPRPAYQEDPRRIYGMSFSHWNVRFRVENNDLIIIEIEER